MINLGQTKRPCPNGHAMDPAWAVCPYCPSAHRDAPELARTIQAGPELAKTVRVVDTLVQPAPPSPTFDGRRTELMQRAPTIAGIAWLVGVEGRDRGAVHRLDGQRVILGAASTSDVVIDHPHVSSQHASLRFKDRTYLLSDLDSSNGTFVNGNQIGQQALTDGDRVRFGSSEWAFKCVLFEDE